MSINDVLVSIFVEIVPVVVGRVSSNDFFRNVATGKSPVAQPFGKMHFADSVCLVTGVHQALHKAG